MTTRSVRGAMPLIIANPQAGGGRAGRQLAATAAHLRRKLGPLDVAVTRHAGHATTLAAAAAAEHRPLVVGYGGDGTLNEIVNGLVGDGAVPAEHLPAVGVLAAGTGGDFRRSLGLGRRPDDQITSLLSGATQPVDVGWLDFTSDGRRRCRRLWINVVSGGLGGLVDLYAARAPAALPGTIAYIQATLRAIVGSRRVLLRCRAVLPDGAVVEKRMLAHVIAVCNGTTFGAGMKVAPQACLDDGLLDVVAIETASKLLLISRLHTLYLGRHLREPGVSHLRCRSLTLEPLDSPEPLRANSLPTAGDHESRRGLFPLDVDGDPLGDVPLAIGLLPGALNVRVPARPS